MDYQVFDTTLRDGAQREGISYSVVDKLAVARLLDEFGVGFIEGGWPGAMPKDTEFFRAGRTELDLKHALLVAFGATRKAGVDVADGPAGAGAARRRDAGRLPGRQVRHPARRAGAAHHRRGEPRDGARHRAPTWSPRAAASSSTASTSSTASASTPTTPRSVVADRARRPAPRRVGHVRHQRRHAAVADHRARSARSSSAPRRRRPDRLGIHCQNDTSCAVANTVAAVEAGVGTSSAPPTATASGPATPTSSPSSRTCNSSSGCPSYRTAAWNRWCASRTPSPRSPTSPPTPTRPTSGPRPSPTRRGCTRARSRWIRCSTTTSTRRSSATTCGSW